MSLLNKFYKIHSILLIILISIGIFYPLIASSAFFLDDEGNKAEFQPFDLDQVRFSQSSFLKWKEQNIKADKNENGLSDVFEARLQDSAELGSFKGESGKRKIKLDDDLFGNQHENPEKIPLDNIPIIVYFPEGDYSSISLLFEELEGKIKSTYKAAINGFAGSINLNALNEFCDALRQFNIPFFIEEDRIYQAQLYYAGRNMNLRPYVWNTLSYDGDQYSSIAIIDTGVDDSHNFFSPGYPGKIVGWRDEVNFLSSPYDDNGHGSHCSGITSGIGNPSYDGSGRTVATTAYNFDYTGYDVVPGMYLFDWTRFNVTDPGLIEFLCEFDDYTPGPDDVDFWAYLYHGTTIVDSYEVNTDSWTHTLSHTVTSGSLGAYSFQFILNLVDGVFDGYVSNFNITFRNEIHWPFDPPRFGSGDPWKGVAPDANLVGVKVLDQYGRGWASDIVDGINWVITNRMDYNITTMSLSLGGPSGDTAMINAINNAVENGIVTVVSAGNSGPGGNFIGSPGDADNVITVAAMSIDDEITDYSSQGGPSYTGNTVKPDITAPGGSFYNLQMFSADTNDNDGEGTYPTDAYANDLWGAQGTSMSAPAVAGASNLLIEAMGGHEDWGYTAIEAKRVKALLLMTATETYPLLRETYSTTYSPLLNRGGKDVHEGYGRLNVDVAIEAYTQELTLGSQFNAWITSSLIDPFNKHGLGCYVNLIEGETYIFTLDVPTGADFDLHLYSNTPTSIGEPIMVEKSISNNLGEDEVIAYTATETGKYYLIAKAISGEGDAVISYPILDHDLHVSLEVPDNPDIYGSYLINATVLNNGLTAEMNVDLYLYIDKVLADSATISTLNVDEELTINYPWTPIHYKSYNFTAYTPILPGEPIAANNYVEEIVKIIPNLNYTMTEGAPYTWIDASGGTELLLGDDDYAAIALPFSFTFYNQTFSTIYLSSNGYLSFTDTSPWDYINVPFPSGDPSHTYMIAPFWDDLYPSSGGQIYIQSFGSYWVAEWLNIYHINGFLIGSFEVVLYETGEIIFNYDYIDYTSSSGYTCGLNLGVDIQYYNSYQGLNDLIDDFSILFTYEKFDHDLRVSLDTPVNPEIGNAYLINATVTNNGLNDESDVDLLLYLDDIIVNSTTISSLPVSASETISYMWIPPDYGIYNFTAYAPPVPDEPYLANNLATELVYIMDITLFDGMYIDHIYGGPGASYPSRFSYSYYSGSLFFEIWDVMGSPFTWYVDSQTRLMSGGSIFGDGTHTPAWIFTDVSLGDEILIAADGEGDHSFLVADQLIYELPGFGDVEVWVLEDLTIPGGIAWYEKSTGILLNGTFYFNGGVFNYTFSFVDTNALDSLTITNPDSLTAWETGTSHAITWTLTGSITNVKIELYKEGVFVLEIVASTPNDGSYTWTIPTDLEDGIDYQIRISDVSNPATSDDSDYFAITSIPIPPGPPRIPGYNLYLVLATICILSIILTKRRIKKA